METYEQITLDQWAEWKEDIRRKLAETAQNFVHIGFRLKQIRDSGMFGGAADIFGFAEREYGLGKSTVSRFIAINERYSEGGDSLELKEEFRAFGSSKLSEMLTLPDNEIQLVTERTTIREIRELKEFNRQGIPEDTEVPGPGGGNAGCPPLEKCIRDFFRDKRDMLEEVMGHMGGDPPGYREAMERMNPSGQASHRKGIVFLFLYDWGTGIKYKLLTQPEPVGMPWTDFLDMVYKIHGAGRSRDVWGDFYGTQETSVATSQQGDGTGKNSGMEEMGKKAAGDISGLPAAAARKTREAKGRPPAAGVKGQEDPAGEEQLPGQLEVYDYPEMVPESMEGGSHGTGGKGPGEAHAADGGMGPCASGGGGGQGPDIPEHDEGPGTAEDDGCAEDPGNAGMTEESAWEGAKAALYALRVRFEKNSGIEKGMDIGEVQAMYRRSIDLAAALEKIMVIRREENGKEHHA